MKNIISFFTISILLHFQASAFPQDPPCELPTPIYITNIPTPSNYVTGELIIYNMTLFRSIERVDTILVKMIPVGAFYNGAFFYSPIATHQFALGDTTKISGSEIMIPPQTISSASSRKIGNFDKGGGIWDFSYGFGKYKLEFYRKVTDTSTYTLANYVYIDFRDAGNDNLLPPYTNIGDIRVDYFSKDSITFQHSPNAENYTNYAFRYWPINLVGKEIKMWDLFGTCLAALIPDKKAFFTDSSNNGAYLKIPINANKYNNNIGHENPGDLGMNLVINHNITTRDTALGNGSITIAKNGYLKIADGKIFNMTTPLVGYHNLIVQDSSLLWLDANSHLYVGAGNRLTLKSTGTIKLGYNSEIRFKAGSLFCNEGGRIIAHEVSTAAGWGKIVFEKGYHQVNCAELSDFVFNDSVKLVLEDSTTLEIPDNTSLHFSGMQTGLIMNPNSKLKMGEGSKILFDSGAYIFANGATFTSIDSTLKWDGIVLSNSDADTIINCTFSNAVTALTFTNNSNSAYKNRIITNNTFNIPSWGVNKGIYGENNYKILLKNNVFNMPVYYPSGSPVPLIYVGVYLKNSSTIEAAGGDIEEDQSSNYSLNIIENTFSNGCASVILANYTSNYLPYIISDNIFNNTASVNIIGMKISGTIRDNNFTSDNVPLGIHLINSSPNLYKNTINSRDVGLHLAGHCYPNLAPYVSGEDLVWTGGNNYITTTDIDNIQLSSSGYVNTDFGNNNFTINNSSSYHIYGWLDSTHNIYYARDNCWNGSAQSRIYLKTYGSSDTVPVPVINYNCWWRTA